VTHQEGDEVDAVNQAATKDAAAKVQEIRDKFQEWVWSDEDRTERLARFYNDNLNNIRDIDDNGQHQTFPGMNPTELASLHPHIKDFVWQVVTTGGGLAAHEVGTGKAGSVDSRLLTPSGWVRMGDIAVGDEIIAGDGRFDATVRNGSCG
jgi:N12 class adenine-specific DNA methylase